VPLSGSAGAEPRDQTEDEKTAALHGKQQSSAAYWEPLTTSDATLVMWFSLRSPDLAEDFERLMADDRDIVRGSLDTVSEWRLTRPLDVPGQSTEAADYVLIAEIVGIQRWQEQETELVQHLEDEVEHLVSSRGMLVVGHVL
jgi:hypothetical protein